jgi:hypothetical protein
MGAEGNIGRGKGFEEFFDLIGRLEAVTSQNFQEEFSNRETGGFNFCFSLNTADLLLVRTV